MSADDPEAADEVLGLARLLRLASPALPIGAFAWSGGLEGAIDQGVVVDAATAEQWIRDLVALGHARWDGPILWAMMVTPDRRPALDALYLASRETAELRAETLQVGLALARVVGDGLSPARSPTLPCAWAMAAEAWGIAPRAALLGWLVALVDNQITVLQKALPLGQVAAQRIYQALLPVVGRAHAAAMTLPEARWSSGLPALAVMSARHETQYSRLFRS